jgi:hypothetical protein
MKNNTNLLFFTVAVLIFLSRLSFVFLGYGAEEDAWGLVITAENIAATGIYEVSRLPGHPLQEIIYSLIYRNGFVMMNLLTVLISSIGFYVFMLILRFFKVSSPVTAAVTLAFIPVVYINSQNVMDYTWALTGIVTSFWFLCNKEYMWSAAFLAMAIGCRITSGAMLFPFLFYIVLFEKGKVINKMLLYVFAVALFSIVCYFPVINEYGLSFFTYYEHFPIPSLVKNIFKGTIGVFGTLGCFAVFFFTISVFIKWKKNAFLFNAEFKRILLVCFSALFLYILAFVKLPLKSAFLIPAMPFLVIIFAMLLSKRQMTILALTMMLSSLFFGINLADANRGSRPSSWSYKAEVSGQEVALDVLNGPVIADYQKQMNLIAFANDVVEKAKSFNRPSAVIAGFYLNYIEVRKQCNENSKVKYLYYINNDSMQVYLKQGFDLYYLPMQDQFNDLRFKWDGTNKLSKPFPG